MTLGINLKRVIREYSEQCCLHKIEHLDEMDQFFERHSLLKLTQEIFNLSRSIST